VSAQRIGHFDSRVTVRKSELPGLLQLGDNSTTTAAVFTNDHSFGTSTSSAQSDKAIGTDTEGTNAPSSDRVHAGVVPPGDLPFAASGYYLMAPDLGAVETR
jgi:hypothetical protein